jgi:hypothetical protein
MTELGGVPFSQPVPKEGFQYTWVMFRPKEDGDKVVPEAIGAYVSDIYHKSDFGLLGIQI